MAILRTIGFVWVIYFFATWTFYGISEQILIKATNAAMRRRGEITEEDKHYWGPILAIMNIREAIRLRKEK